ncbi:MAG TPA: AAA family ATPase, partial [Candidatus Dormibacteraeota bacterium]
RVKCDAAYSSIAAALLGGIRVGREITADGVFHQPGLVRAGADAGVEIETRRRSLRRRLDELEPLTARATDLSEEAIAARSRLSALEARAADRPRLDDAAAQLATARTAAEAQAAELPALEEKAAAAAALAAELARAREIGQRLLAEHESEARRLEVDRLRWRERIHDREQRIGAADRDSDALLATREHRLQRAAEAEAQAAELEARVPAAQAAAGELTSRLAEVEVSSPTEEAELAEAARRLVQLEEARIDARLKAGNLEGNLELAQRESDLAAARMEEIRGRLPEGIAPDEIPGGKAREREMRQLERLLEEIGPTNPLAAAELLELEERSRTLAEQLDDITAARVDLEGLIARLREEEETRYEAVFGAVAANFQELFGELSGGGRATLRHVAGDDGGATGVEILVQPPRKRLQNVTLLSSGERSLTAFALVMALEAVNPSPFVILDEVDAALDDANVGRFGSMLQRLGRERQLLVITHNHATMACASTLCGIHLDESGCSHVVSVRLEEIRGRQIARTA